MKCSLTYLQLNLWQAKVYNKQMKYDLSLKSLTLVKDIAYKNTDDAHSLGYLAEIFDEIGATYALQNRCFVFDGQYLQAIKIRKAQRGRINFDNVIAYCELARNLVQFDDIQSANKYMDLAYEIVSQFREGHPYSWIYYSTMSILSQKQQDLKKSRMYLSSSLKIMQKRRSMSDMVLIRHKRRKGYLYNKSCMYQKAQEVYKQLKQVLSKIQQKVIRQQETVQCKQNEKQRLKQVVDKQLRRTQDKIRLKNSRMTMTQ